MDAENTSYSFRLPSDFVAEYAKKVPPFGYNGLGEVTYRRSYSRLKEDGSNEKWFETVERVVNGTYTMMYHAASKNENSPWIEDKAIRSAKKMYDKMFHMKFLPPGRGLYAMGTKITDTLRLYASLNNCAFVSTQEFHDKDTDRTKPFHFLMLMSMMGVGVGFDVKGDGAFRIYSPTKDPHTFEDIDAETINVDIEDSREGWVSSTVTLLRAYFYPGEKNPVFSYDNIRPKGEPLKTFGGIAPGPEPLKKLHTCVRRLLEDKVGLRIDTFLITDIMNMIGTCVVAGGVRRTAEIALGDLGNEDFVHLKDFGTYRSEWMWTSNNSVCLPRMENKQIAISNFLPVTVRTAANGEPGYYWIHNMQGFGRMNREKDVHVKDPIDPMIKYDLRQEPLATGTNPCAEQTLESYELCCLVETFPHLHTTKREYIQTLKYAYLYAKVVTTGMTQWEESNNIIERNRRVGCSMTGVAQFVDQRGRKRMAHMLENDPGSLAASVKKKVKHVIREEGQRELIKWCEDGYRAIRNWDITYSSWMNIPKSVKVTSIKPSGTVSLIGGATPGMHWPIEKFYKRRIRIEDSSPLVRILENAGYPVEKDTYADNTMVVTFPVYCGSETMRLESEVSMEDQLDMAALLQKHWADNQVSVTIKFWKDSDMKECMRYSSILCDIYIHKKEDFKKILSSRKVIDYSNSKFLQEMLDNRWEEIDCADIFAILSDFAEYCAEDCMLCADEKYDKEKIRGTIQSHITERFPIDSYSEERTLLEERVTDFLIVIKAAHIADLLYRYQDKLKAVSFLPMEKGVYAQAPYEHMEYNDYVDMVESITPVHHWNMVMPQPEQPIGCDGDSCTAGSLGHSST